MDAISITAPPIVNERSSAKLVPVGSDNPRSGDEEEFEFFSYKLFISKFIFISVNFCYVNKMHLIQVTIMTVFNPYPASTESD